MVILKEGERYVATGNGARRGVRQASRQARKSQRLTARLGRKDFRQTSSRAEFNRRRQKLRDMRQGQFRESAKQALKFFAPEFKRVAKAGASLAERRLGKL